MDLLRPVRSGPDPCVVRPLGNASRLRRGPGRLEGTTAMIRLSPVSPRKNRRSRPS